MDLWHGLSEKDKVERGKETHAIDGRIPAACPPV